VNNIDMDPGKKLWGGVDCIHLAQDRHKRKDFVNTLMNLCVP
jgi:hypothetical protein